MATRELVPSSYIDAKEFRFLAKALKKAAPAMYTDLKRNLKGAGELIAKDARTISSRYSTSIPPTIKTRTRGLTVYVEAGGNFGGAGDRKVAKELFAASYGTTSSNASSRRAEEGVVIAGLFEAGNKGGKSKAAIERGTFRHPVYGNMDAWVNQEMHPYLLPAYKKNEAAVLALIIEALTEVTKIIVTED